MQQIILITIVNATLLMEGLLLWRYTDHNRLQRTLMMIIVLWLVIFVGLQISVVKGFYSGVESSRGVMNFRGIFLGLFGLFSLLSYPAIVLHSRLLTLRNSLLFLSPVLVLLLIYFVWHLATGTPMDYRYMTFEQLWAHRFTVPVVLRGLILLSFMSYLVVVLRNIWKLIPIYNRYSEQNYSDVAHNAGWLKMVIVVIASICAIYLVLLMWKNPVAELLYAGVVAISFAVLTDNAVFHKLFTQSDQLQIEWNRKKGWQVIELPHIADSDSTDELQQSIEQWMVAEKPFCNPDFSVNDLYAKFDRLNTPLLGSMLERRGLNFQSYVRQHRIEEACRLMAQDPRMVGKEIASKIGFSSCWVLSRAFVAVKGITAREFRTQLGDRSEDQ